MIAVYDAADLVGDVVPSEVLDFSAVVLNDLAEAVPRLPQKATEPEYRLVVVGPRHPGRATFQRVSGPERLHFVPHGARHRHPLLRGESSDAVY